MEPQGIEKFAKRSFLSPTDPWYEFARTPNWFQNQNATNVKAYYNNPTYLEDGRVIFHVTNVETVDGKTRYINGTGVQMSVYDPSKYCVEFAKMYGVQNKCTLQTANYIIYGVFSLYKSQATAMIVGNGEKDMLWILTRTPTITSSEYSLLSLEAAQSGFNVGKLTRTTHRMQLKKSGALTRAMAASIDEAIEGLDSVIMDVLSMPQMRGYIETVGCPPSLQEYVDRIEKSGAVATHTNIEKCSNMLSKVERLVFGWNLMLDSYLEKTTPDILSMGINHFSMILDFFQSQKAPTSDMEYRKTKLEAQIRALIEKLVAIENKRLC